MPLSDEQILHLQEINVGGVCPQSPLDNSDWISFARDIESAATAPLLAQIADLEVTVRRHEIALLQSVDQLAKVTQLEAQLAEAQQEQPSHLWDGSPWPNYVVTSQPLVEVKLGPASEPQHEGYHAIRK